MGQVVMQTVEGGLSWVTNAHADSVLAARFIELGERLALVQRGDRRNRRPLGKRPPARAGLRAQGRDGTRKPVSQTAA
jgi:hypothetical protein